MTKRFANNLLKKRLDTSLWAKSRCREIYWM